MAATAAGFAPPMHHLSPASKLRSADASRLQALPPQKSLDEYAPTTKIPPYFGYDLINTDVSERQVEVTGYVVGAPIDDLFKLASDFTEKAPFGLKLFSRFNQPSYRSGDPNGVGDVRDFVWTGGNQYVEQLSFSDPNAHTFVYTLHASSTVQVLDSVITYVSFVNEPDQNRVKVTWRSLIQPTFPIPFFVVKKAQFKAYTENIVALQTFFPVAEK